MRTSSLTASCILACLCILEPAIAGDCRAVVNVRGDGVPDSVVQSASVEITESQTGTPIKLAREGAAYLVESPSKLYRFLEIRATANTHTARTAFFLGWPCDASQTIVTLVISGKPTTVEELSEMWRNKALIAPPDKSSAELFYFRALSIAKARLQSNPNGRHQYDLIAAYLALRQYQIYAKLSRDVPIAMTEDLRRIKDWFLELLGRVSLNNLDVIVKEKNDVANETFAKILFYTRAWKSIQEMTNVALAFQAMDRFIRSIEEEPNGDLILAGLSLTRAELLASANAIAGRMIVSASSLTSLSQPPIRAAWDRQLQRTDRYVRENPGSERLMRDVAVLRSRIGS